MKVEITVDNCHECPFFYRHAGMAMCKHPQHNSGWDSYPDRLMPVNGRETDKVLSRVRHPNCPLSEATFKAR